MFKRPRYLAAAPILALVAGAACADWEFTVDAGQGVRVYSDFVSAVRKGDDIKMWSLMDFDDEQNGPTGKPYKSQKLQIGYECGERESKLLYIVQYPEPMGDGDVTYQAATIEEAWRPIVPDSVRARIFEEACRKVSNRRVIPAT